MPACPVVAIAALLILSWVSALSAPMRDTRAPEAKRVRPCPNRVETRSQAPAPAPITGEHECAFGELLDCNYGGHARR